jgi:retron-type reverse transcriptase
MGKMNGSSSPTDISTKQRRIAELAKQMPEKPLTTLAHNIDMLWLKEAFRRTRKDAAPGVDGQTWRGYSESLDNHLADLLGRAKSGQYKAPAVRRVRIPKGSGGTRPIGIPTIEDKVLQRAVVMVLEPIYEREFLDCSYGFRPGRSAHQALAVLPDFDVRMPFQAFRLSRFDRLACVFASKT